MATTGVAQPRSKGGAFLLDQRQPGEIFTPEDFTEEHRAIARTAEDFWNREVVPNLEAIQHQEPGVAVGVLKKSAELGLAAVVVPERFG
ncbi:MAG: acyl-CoA dehydrogenase family protein, partial [Bryobacteraceae bacterium]